MPLVPAAPPQAVPVLSGFDYVTVDPQRRLVFAAHTSSAALLIVDADSGAVLGQVRVGPMHGLAVNPANGHVFTANGLERSVSEVDPQAQKVVRSVDLPAVLDALAFDAARGRIYIDEDDGPHLFVLDGTTAKRRCRASINAISTARRIHWHAREDVRSPSFVCKPALSR